MSIRDVEPIGWTWNYAMDCWREVYDDDDDDDDAPEDNDADVEEENFGEACLTARERN